MLFVFIERPGKSFFLLLICEPEAVTEIVESYLNFWIC